jgi:hypothetical protein
MLTEFWWEDVKEKCNWEDTGVNDRTAIKWMLRNRQLGMN